jgi:hypothetical protein
MTIKDPANKLFVWERNTVSYRLSGVFRKTELQFQPSEYDPNPRFYASDWKFWRRVRNPVSAAKRAATTIRNSKDTTWRILIDNTQRKGE